MEINKLGNLAPATVEKKSQPQKVKDTGLKKDTFTLEAEPYDSKKAQEYLSGLKDKYGSPVLYDRSVEVIIERLDKHPQNWPYIKNCVGKENVSDFALQKMANCEDENKLKSIVEMSEIKDKEGNLRFECCDIGKILEMDQDQVQNAKKLVDTPINHYQVFELAKNEKDLNFDKVAKISNSLVAMIDKDNLNSFSVQRDDYKKGEYTAVAKRKDYTYLKETFDKNGKITSIEESESFVNEAAHKEYKLVKCNDKRNHTVSKVRYEVGMKDETMVTHEVRIVKDKNDKVLRTDYLEPSDVKGVFNIKQMFPDGKVNQISKGTLDKKTGIMTVEKNMVSPNGTKTEYFFSDDPQGNRISNYKITDKNGKVLLNNSQSFEVVDDKTFISAKNNQKFKIELDERGNNIKVSDMNKPEREPATFGIYKNISGNTQQIMNVLKQMPGEELFKLSEDTTKLNGIHNPLGSYSETTAAKREITTGNDLFVILHELGHAVDMKDVDMQKEKETINKAIFNDPKFMKIYEKEKAAFNKAYPDAQRDHIAYFINHETHYNHDFGGRKETIAEANALLQTPKTPELLAIRSQYLQQNFPETIAYLDKKLAEPAENPNRTYSDASGNGWSH